MPQTAPKTASPSKRRREATSPMPGPGDPPGGQADPARPEHLEWQPWPQPPGEEGREQQGQNPHLEPEAGAIDRPDKHDQKEDGSRAEEAGRQAQRRVGGDEHAQQGGCLRRRAGADHPARVGWSLALTEFRHDRQETEPGNPGQDQRGIAGVGSSVVRAPYDRQEKGIEEGGQPRQAGNRDHA